MLENAKIEKVGQNLKYDLIVLRAQGVDVVGVAFDTMIASYLLEAGQRNHNLDDLASRYLHHTNTKISELIGTGKNQKRMDEVPVALVSDYACEDADAPMRLRPILARLLDEAGLTELFTTLEMPLVDVLVEMETNGIRVDRERLEIVEYRIATGEKRQLRRRGPTTVISLLLQLKQHFLSALDDPPRQACQFGDVNPVRFIRSARNDLVQEHDLSSLFAHRDVVISHTGQALG